MYLTRAWLLISSAQPYIFNVVFHVESFTDGICEASCATCVCPSFARQKVGNGAKTVQCARPLTWLACFVACQLLSLLFTAFTENKPPRMASSRLNVDSPQLTIYLRSGPDSRRCWINTASSERGGGIFMLSLEDTAYTSTMPLTPHLSASWWIPLIKDLWCYILSSAYTPSVLPI